MKQIISTTSAPAAIGPYSQAVAAGGFLYISGQLPVNPQVGTIETADISKQTVQVFTNIEAILTAAGYSFADVIKSTVFLTDISHFAEMNEIYRKIYSAECPARSAFAVKALPMGALVEIETIAYRQD